MQIMILKQNLKKDSKEILVNNIFRKLLILIFLTNCSFNQNSKFWTNNTIKPEKIRQTEQIKEIFKKKSVNNSEFNPSLKISLNPKIKNVFYNNLDNNKGRINYKGNFKNISKFKFSKIKNFDQYDPELSFENENIIFFDNKGSILKFNNKSKLIWKKNYYKKSEKKQNPILFFANNKKILIVTDNIAKYYALDINTGELLWSKNNTAPFNSQIKIFKDKFYVIDFTNTLRAYSIKDGKEIWSIGTEKSFIRSQMKLSLVIIDKIIYFNNSLGDISAVDIEEVQLLWQIPTQSSLIYEDSFFLKTSEIVSDQKSLYLSNNKNEFFSIDINSGMTNWKQEINSNLLPILVENYIFTITLEGYFTIIDKYTGNIIRSTDIFKNFSLKKRKKIKPTGFIVGNNNIYITTSNGKLLVADIMTGITLNLIKIDNEKISRPSILNQSLYIIKNNSIIKMD